MCAMGRFCPWCRGDYSSFTCGLPSLEIFMPQHLDTLFPLLTLSHAFRTVKCLYSALRHMCAFAHIYTHTIQCAQHT